MNGSVAYLTLADNSYAALPGRYLLVGNEHKLTDGLSSTNGHRIAMHARW